MIDLLVVLAVIGIGLQAVSLYLIAVRLPMKEEDPRIHPAVIAAVEEEVGAFPVDRNPRSVPWKIRRREKEAAARTRRRAMEEL